MNKQYNLKTPEFQPNIPFLVCDNEADVGNIKLRLEDSLLCLALPDACGKLGDAECDFLFTKLSHKFAHLTLFITIRAEY